MHSMPRTVTDTDWLFEVEPKESPCAAALREIRQFAQDYKKFGGLLTSKQVQALLDVSRQRVSKMTEAGILEVREYDGARYYTGRSVLARINEAPPKKGGRPKTSLSTADRLRFFAGAFSAED